MTIRKRRTIIEVARRGRKGEAGIGTVNIDTDTTLAANSDVVVPSQKAVKAYIDPTIEQADIMSALRFDPAAKMYGAVRGAVSTEQRTLNTAALQLAADDALSADGTLVIKGLYEIDGTITVQSHIDGFGGELLTYNPSGVTLMYGRTDDVSVWNRRAVFPTVEQATRPGPLGLGPGWNTDDVGVHIANVRASFMEFNRVAYFSTNIKVSSYGSQGVVDNTVVLAENRNGKVGLHLDVASAGSWLTETLWLGGKWGFNSSEGVEIPGTRHILVTRHPDNPYRIDKHRFVKPNLESAGPEFQIELNNVDTFLFDHTRLEMGAVNPTIKPKIKLIDCQQLVMFYGYAIDQIVFTGDTNNVHMYHKFGLAIPGTQSGGTLRLSHAFSSSDHPLLLGMGDPGAQIGLVGTDGYVAYIGTKFTRFKLKADTYPRFELNYGSGGISWGNGISSPDVGIERKLSTPEGSLDRGKGSMVLSPDGNAYIKTTSLGTNTGWFPAIHGGSDIRPQVVDTLPSATVARRGIHLLLKGAAGVADEAYVCRKNTDDAYEWVKLTP